MCLHNGFNGQGTRIQAQICIFTALTWIKSHILEQIVIKTVKIRPGLQASSSTLEKDLDQQNFVSSTYL